MTSVGLGRELRTRDIPILGIGTNLVDLVLVNLVVERVLSMQ